MNIKRRKALIWSGVALLLAAGILTAVLISANRYRGKIRVDEELWTINVVNQQLQNVMIPQLNGNRLMYFQDEFREGNHYFGGLNYKDLRLYLNGTDGADRLIYAGLVGSYKIENDELTVESRYYLNEVDHPYETFFYSDLLIPSREFYRNNVDGDPLDLSRLVVDDSRLNDPDYCAERVEALNAFFGTTLHPDNPWESILGGRYAIVFSLDPDLTVEEQLAALAELDETEGVHVTGIYYQTEQGEGAPALCKPLREDDPVNPKTLDPRESLRLLAASPEIVNMLLSSELYGGASVPDFGAILWEMEQYSWTTAEPIGACVILDRNSLLTPDMHEAISKVCYRCIDVELLSKNS